MRTKQMKELISILIGSSLYFDLTLYERQELIERLLPADLSIPTGSGKDE